jgi:hypothetical protein
MPTLSTTELKKSLLAEGFEIYRTLPDRVVVADRVRDNLIMDSGVSVGTGASCVVHFVVRCQRNDFPNETEQELFERARVLGADALARGYREVGTSVVKIPDPGERTRILDVWYEVAFERDVGETAGLPAELRYALGLQKTAPRTRA